MARKAGALVLLVADIDGAGCSAAPPSGALSPLTNWRAAGCSRGFIINKFRGECALFEEGVCDH